MNYLQTIDYLYNKLPMFSRLGSAAFKKDLTNTVLLCNHLGNPQTRFKSIHVGGTNGKGSTSHMIAAVLQSSGFKTGLYTSPHLYHFRERIRINGQMIEESFVVDFVQNVRTQIEEIEPSFFEITVAMAFQYFSMHKVDLAVIEVGLGGRLDSTNIITPELSVITNIGMDHMNILGNTMQDIAGEKAGIIKKNIPVVIGERQKEIESVFIEKAKKESAPLLFASDRFEIQKAIKKKNWLEVIVRDNMLSTTETYQLDLTANYQTKNLCTVLQSISLLQQNFSIDEKVVNSALRRVKEITGFFGRWEVIHDTPKIVLDVAHNEAGIREMIKQLKTEFFNQLHLVIGMVKDKDITAVLQMFPVNAFYYFTQTNIPRALSEEELKEKAFAFGLKGESYANVNDALKAAKSKASSNDLILVCGSIFLVSEVDISLLKTEGGQSLPTHT